MRPRGWKFACGLVEGVLPTILLGLRRKTAPLHDQEPVGGDAECTVMVEPSPALPLKMAETQFLLQFFVIALSDPMVFGHPHQIPELRRPPAVRNRQGSLRQRQGRPDAHSPATRKPPRRSASIGALSTRESSCPASVTGKGRGCGPTMIETSLRSNCSSPMCFLGGGSWPLIQTTVWAGAK